MMHVFFLVWMMFYPLAMAAELCLLAKARRMAGLDSWTKGEYGGMNLLNLSLYIWIACKLWPF